jgi:hypothetical protein
MGTRNRVDLRSRVTGWLLPGPRDAINFDDGFAGYNTVRGNLVFNTMRETNDGDPFNMWDRTPFITPDKCFYGARKRAGQSTGRGELSCQ